jgi:hypothetical protein
VVLRHVAVVLITSTAGCGSASHPGDLPDPAFDPAYLTSSEFCTARGRVDRVDRVDVCHDAGHQRYTTTAKRGVAGWVSSRGDTFELDETTHLDADLAAGVRTLCAGTGSAELAYPSLHREDLGWPIFICDPTPELVLYRDGATVVLPAPVASELAEVYFIVGVHDFGLRAVFDDE